jgi:hypothetical protein
MSLYGNNLLSEKKMRTLTCDPTTEVIGQAILSFVHNLQSAEIRPHLVRHDLDQIDPSQWYPVSRFFDMLNEMYAEGNTTSNLVAIGMSVVDNMVVPPEMVGAPLSAYLEGWDFLYKHQHRNGQMGEIRAERLAPTHYRIIFSDLYPDDFSYGIAFGMARRFLPPGTPFTVAYTEGNVNRDDGGQVTMLDVKWQA